LKLAAKIFKGNQTGGALVEFALILPLILLLVFGIIEFSLLLYNKAVITNASREGARLGIVYAPTRPTASQITTHAKSYCGSYLVSFGNDTPSSTLLQGPCANTGENLEVQVVYNYSFLIFPDVLSGFFGGTNTSGLQLSARTVMRCE
jgi:Flp pilus assembly protein TadG